MSKPDSLVNSIANPSAVAPGPHSRWLGFNYVRRMQRDLLGFCVDMERAYGDFVAFRVGPVSFFQCTHPELVQEVLVRQARKFHKPRQVKTVFGQWDGEGLLLSEGDFWARQRRLVQGAFHPNRVRLYAGTTAVRTQAMLDRWQSLPEVNAVEEMPRLTLDIVGHALFDADLVQEAHDIAAAVDTLQEVALVEAGSVVPVPNWLPTARNRRKRWAIGVLHTLVERLIRERRASGRDHGDLLSMLLAATDSEGDGGSMSDTQARDEATTLLLAGHETTAVSLMWTLYYLAAHPEIQESIAAPLSQFRGSRAPTADDLLQLAPVAMAFKEAIRLRGPVYFFGREAIEDVELRGVRIPRGSQVNLVPYITHHDARWFADPESFRPERFTPEREAELPPLAYFPFGGGPRVCIGRGMAMMEGTIVLAMIVSRYRVALAPGQGDPGLEAQVSLHPRGPLRLVVSAR